MKKILIIGAGFLQSFLIKKVKEMGYYTIAIDKNPKAVGFKYADEYSVIDIINQEECLIYAQNKNINGVITVATDYGVLTTSYIAKSMNLPGLEYEVAKVIKNKYKVRQILFSNNVDDISQYFEVESLSAINKIEKQIKFPVMVKPCDGSGSKATKKVDDILNLKDACDDAIQNSLVNKALIEDFIEGKEYGVESLVYNGEIYILAVINKHMTSPPDYAELGHFLPSQLDIVEEKVRAITKKAIQSLGINFGAVNMDVLITKNENVCIVDIGARMGGNLIGSHIIPYGTGIDYMENLIRMTADDPIDLKAKNKVQKVSTRILDLKPGKVFKLPDFEKIKQEYNVDIFHHLSVGKEINEYHNNLDGCGYVLSVSDNLDNSLKSTKEAKDIIDLKIVRE